MKNKLIVIVLFLICTSCASSKKVNYLQNADLFIGQQIQQDKQIVLQPQDAITIVVSSKDPKLAALFNLPKVTYRAGATQLSNTSYDSQISEYTVDSNGDIDFPVIGKVKISGLKREEVASLIKEQLIAADLIKDPVVTVEYVNLYYSLVGEVARPGKYKIDREKVNIFEAVGAAGDLTIFGRRDAVYVTREEGQNRIIYKLDLRSKEVFESPAFYIKQNDIIYVEPNKVRANQSTINGNSTRSVSTWLSIASVLTTLAVLIFK